MFEPTVSILAAGKLLAEFIDCESNWMTVAKCHPMPEEIKKAMKVFDHES